MGSNIPNRNRNDQMTAERTLLDGLLKQAAAIPSMVIDGTFMTNRDLVAMVQSRVDSAQAVLSTKASWLAALQAEQAEHEKTRTFVSGVKQGLIVAFGRHIDTLADFGLTAPSQHVRTPEEKLAVIAKSSATRAARHTMGARQKAAIKGTVVPGAPPDEAPDEPAET